MLKTISVLAISLIFGFTGIVFASEIDSHELDASDLNEAVSINEMSSIQTDNAGHDNTSMGFFPVSGTWSNELDSTDVDSSSHADINRSYRENVDQVEKDNSRRLLCASSLGYASEEHAGDYCQALQEG